MVDNATHVYSPFPTIVKETHQPLLLHVPYSSPPPPCYSLNREKIFWAPLWWVFFSRMRAGTMNNSRVAGYTGGEEVSNQGSSSAHNAVCLFIRSRDRISRPRTIEYICILIRARLEPPARLYLTKKKKEFYPW